MQASSVSPDGRARSVATGSYPAPELQRLFCGADLEAANECAAPTTIAQDFGPSVSNAAGAHAHIERSIFRRCTPFGIFR